MSIVVTAALLLVVLSRVEANLWMQEGAISRGSESSDNSTSDVVWGKLRVEHRDHTFADLETYRTLHLTLNLTVDMEGEEVEGYVETTLVKLRPSWSYSFYGLSPGLVLDIGPFVSVHQVEDVTGGTDVSFNTHCRGKDDDPTEVLRCVLIVQDPISGVGEVQVRIHYTVDRGTSALHFIQPHMTMQGSHKFLTAITQPSDARGWIPCQDTPAVKFPYRAQIRVKEPYSVLMSATTVSSSIDALNANTKVFQFEQKYPVAPYLIAITVGVLDKQDIQNGTEDLTTRLEEGGSVPVRLYGEPVMIDRIRTCNCHLTNMIARMLDLCESKWGRYRWDRYDIVLTPPGYMFLGMEFPGMNYISSTQLDLDDLDGINFIFAEIVAHEMIHSWFGNQVTPKWASNAWLAEGLTVYASIELVEDYFGDPEAGMFKRQEKYSALQETLLSYREGDVAPKYRELTPLLHNEHPFHGFTFVIYSKGALFMEYIAHETDRASVNVGLRDYAEVFRYRSVESYDLLQILYQTSPDLLELEGKLLRWVERPNTHVQLELFPSKSWDNCTRIIRGLTRIRQKSSLNMETISGAYKKRQNRPGLERGPEKFLRAQMFVILGRIKSAAQKANVTKERNLNKWVSLIHGLDAAFEFSAMWDTDPDMFSRWAGLSLIFNHQPTIGNLELFMTKHGRLDLLFAYLGASPDPAVNGKLAHILNTKYDLLIYPGFIGRSLVGFMNYFLPHYQP